MSSQMVNHYARKVEQLEAKVRELEGKFDSLTDDFVTSQRDLARAMDWINEVEPLVKQFPALVNILCTLSNGVGAEIEAAINNEADLAAYWSEADEPYLEGSIDFDTGYNVGDRL